VLRLIIAAALRLAGRLLNREAETMDIMIAGKAIPVADIEAVASAIGTAASGVKANKSPADIVKSLVPVLEGLTEDAASIFLSPLAGGAAAIVFDLINQARPATKEDEERLNERNVGGEGQ